jgi:hypothetical protein
VRLFPVQRVRLHNIDQSSNVVYRQSFFILRTLQNTQVDSAGEDAGTYRNHCASEHTLRIKLHKIESY